ncbi:MAG: hypothetical protein HDT29_00150 [Clostridiales bacterium]|nr:hypothetical protein [Clostridiales bacterium]
MPNLKYETKMDTYSKLPGNPIAYWIGLDLIKCFEEGKRFDSFGEPKSGVMTGDDNKFIRLWFEPISKKIGFGLKNAIEMKESMKKWFPVTRGGSYRKWFGNLEEIVNLENGGYAIKNNGKNYRLRDEKYYMQEGLTWTMITTTNLSVRIAEAGVLFGNGGPTTFVKEKEYYLLGLLNSKVVNAIVSVLNPTMNIVISDICSIPVIFNRVEPVETIVANNLVISKYDWNAFETSWDFKRHPLI